MCTLARRTGPPPPPHTTTTMPMRTHTQLPSRPTSPPCPLPLCMRARAGDGMCRYFSVKDAYEEGLVDKLVPGYVLNRFRKMQKDLKVRRSCGCRGCGGSDKHDGGTAAPALPLALMLHVVASVLDSGLAMGCWHWHSHWCIGIGIAPARRRTSSTDLCRRVQPCPRLARARPQGDGGDDYAEGKPKFRFTRKADGSAA